MSSCITVTFEENEKLIWVLFNYYLVSNKSINMMCQFQEYDKFQGFFTLRIECTDWLNIFIAYTLR